MKYIRTEHNIFEVVGENKCVYRIIGASRERNNVYSRTKKLNDVVKKANTIEELCDFEMHYDHNGEFVIRPIKHVEFSSLRKAVMENHFKDCKLAIKTDKGLIYIAYMNNEGIFKLL